MRRSKWRPVAGRWGVGTILLIAVGLLMMVPSVGGTRAPALDARERPDFSLSQSSRVTPDSSCASGGDSYFPAYDPVNHYVYVPNQGVDYTPPSVAVLSGACALVATISLPTDGTPVAAAFNPTNNEVYVTDEGLNQVYVISGLTLSTTVTSSSFDQPYGIAFDPGDAVMGVANYGSNTVTFLSGTSVSFTVTVGSEPYLLAYDPVSDRFLVSNFGSSNVTSINAVYPFDESSNINIAVPEEPTGIAFDPADSEDYVSSLSGGGSGDVTEFSGTAGVIAYITAGGGPEEAVWDQATLSVDVANVFTSTVSEIQGTTVVKTITGPTNAIFYGIAYDEATDQVFVMGSVSERAYVYGKLVSSAGPVSSGTSCAAPVYGLYEYPAYDPVNHDIYVPGGFQIPKLYYSNTITILNGACQLVKTLTLPTASEPYAAAFDPTNNEVYVTDGVLHHVYVLSGTHKIATITSSSFERSLGIAFDPGNGEMAVSNYGSDTVTFISGTTVVGTTTVGYGPLQFAFDPYYDRFLVTNQLSDNVTSMSASDPMNSADDNSIVVGYEPTGIAYDYADSEDYVSNFGSNNLSVFYGDGTSVGSIAVGVGPVGEVWDQSALAVYLVNVSAPHSIWYSALSVIQGLSVVSTTATYVYAGFPGIAYDSATDQVFVTDFELAGVRIFS